MPLRRIALLTLCLAAALAADEKPRPPVQPASGPGGAEQTHAKVIESQHGKGDTQYWLFEPDAPRPEKAPLVVFLHGWGGMLPSPYGAWIDHLVHRGNIVVYPRYQGTLFSNPKRFDRNAYAAIADALERLSEEGHVKPDLDHVAVVGHSFGGSIAANYAAAAGREHLPVPKALMVVEPGNGDKGLGMEMTMEDLSQVRQGTLVLVVAGEDDNVVGTETALRYFHALTSVGKEDREYILVRSDDHGDPPLRATHFAPCGPRPGEKQGELLNAIGGIWDKQRLAVTALATHGYWKWFDGLCDAAFFGKNRQYALGNTPEQRDLGMWSDGTPVKEPLVTDEGGK